MRQWRKDHPPSEVEREHAITRAYTNVLIRRGTLERQPCQECGSHRVQAHHPDYRDPRWVIWLCALHHRELHAVIRRMFHVEPRSPS